MSLATNRQLLDLSTRLQLYIEGVKNHQVAKQNAILFELQSAISPLLLKTEYKHLDRLSKTKLLQLVVELRKRQSRIFNLYVERLIKDLNLFMEASLITHRGVWASAYAKEGEGEAFPLLSREEALLIIGSAGGKSLFGIKAITQDPSALWAKLKNSPMAANGQTLMATMAGFSIASQMAIENAVRKAWANKQTSEELLTQLFDTSKQGFASELQKIINNSNATTATLLQHVAAIVDNAIQSALFDRYVWISVIDSATTQICRSRNNKKFVYGEGPLPPAHYWCRSSTAPYNGGPLADAESFFEWLMRQPDVTKRYVLGKNYAKFERGELSPEDIPKVSSFAPLSIAEFKSREIITNILASR